MALSAGLSSEKAWGGKHQSFPSEVSERFFQFPWIMYPPLFGHYEEVTNPVTGTDGLNISRSFFPTYV